MDDNELMVLDANESEIPPLSETDHFDSGAVDCTEEDLTLEIQRPCEHPVYEDIALRDTNKKVFSEGNPVKQAVFYAAPVHVMNEAGQFSDLKPSIEEDDEEKCYKSNQGGFLAKFNREKDSNALFSVEKDGCKVAFSLLDTGKRSGSGVPVVIPAESKEKNPQVAYAMEDANFIYEVDKNRVKENIEITQAAPAYRYTFTVDCAGVDIAVREEERTIHFNSLETGNEVFMIPAPFMTDVAGVSSDAVFYEVRTLRNGQITLSVIADSTWINDADRVFPVTIDPQVVLSEGSSYAIYQWKAPGSMVTAGSTTLVGRNASCVSHRMYMSLKIPSIAGNPKIRKAQLQVKQLSSRCSSRIAKVGLYQVTDLLPASTPVHNNTLLDYADVVAGTSVYTFDLTAVFDSMYKKEAYYSNLMLNLLDSNQSDNVTLYSALVGANAPQLIVTYENGYQVNVAAGAAHELGWFGTGSVDLATGTMVAQAADLTWDGNRMPVMIHHMFSGALANRQYTNNPAIDLNTANFDGMKLGFGWRLNWMQSMVSKTFLHDGESCNGYVYTDEFGESVYFLERTETYMQKEIEINCETVTYALYTDTSRKGYAYDPMLRELYICAETYLFDKQGRLVKVTDASGNSREIHYTAGKIMSITDGAERAFALNYNGAGELTSITAPDGTTISYSYTNGYLTGVTNREGAYTAIAYTEGQITSVSLYDTPASEDFTYRVQYTYDTRGRITEVKEFGASDNVGQSTAYSYDIAARKTTAVSTVDHMDTMETVTTVYTFNDDGDLMGSYVQTEDGETVQLVSVGNEINPYVDGVGYGENAENLLSNHAFASLTGWSKVQGNSCSLSAVAAADQSSALYGRTALRMIETKTNAGREGVYQVTNVLNEGMYTFSAYVKFATDITDVYSDAGVYLRVTDTSNREIARSERFMSKDDAYVRLAVPFTLDVAQSVKVWICMQGKGTVFADAAQLEKKAFAGPYNYLENGNFAHSGNGWTMQSAVTSTAQSFDGSRALCMNGSLIGKRSATQTISVKSYANVREQFTLSGWAKAPGLPKKEHANGNTAAFCLTAKLNYTDGTFEAFTADFSSATKEWQYASVQIVKSQYKAVENLQIFCEYNYNAGTAYFDCIQLVRDLYQTGLTQEDFLTDSGEEDLDPGESEQEEIFEEAMDAFGNAITETIFVDGEYGTIYRSNGYNEDDPSILGDNAGNDLVRITDERGKNIYYTVDHETSQIQTVTDRCGYKTEFEYDNSRNVTKMTTKTVNTELANISYTYDKMGNLTQITRGDGMQYSINYDTYHRVADINAPGIGALVSYTYGANNGRLKTVAMKDGTASYIYNRFGQIVSEKWEKDDVVTEQYRYTYNAAGQVVRCVDILQEKEYTYVYENGKICRSTENDVALDQYDKVISRSLVSTVLYKYNPKGKVGRKRVLFANGEKKDFVYSYTENNQAVVTLPTNAVSKSGTDHLGRKTFETIELGSGYLSRQFTYHSGEITPEHIQHGKVKTAPTTRLVDTITYSDGRTISYQYDAEQRITKVTDSVDGITEYRYNAYGQLVREIKNNVETQYLYTAYGNLSRKGGKAYGYMHKDLLSSYDGETISYGTAGNLSPNPTVYRGLNLTWSKGRQLTSASGRGKTMQFTYNHIGIRTGKVVNGAEHTYVLEGTKILRDTYNGVDYLYDNEENVCGMVCGGSAYYFIKNLQGDVIAITNAAGKVIARYSYDAWGCHTIQGVAVTSGSYCTTAAFGKGIAEKNLFRYRSYVWDSDLNMYYLQSRYYDPETGRFINADTANVLGVECFNPGNLNLFAYCANNPVIYYDPTGEGYLLTFGIITLAGAIIGGIIGAALSYSSFDRVKWKYVVAGAALGAVVGAATAFAVKAIGVSCSGAVSRGLYKSLSQGVNFAVTPLEHMTNPNRYVPVRILIEAIKHGSPSADPQGSKAIMYTITMIKNGSKYLLEVLYDKASNTIFHFVYKHF